MPETDVWFYQEADGRVPVLEWLRELRRKDPRGYANCRKRIHLLEQHGYELRRPLADQLRKGIYELRARRGKVHHRILYFFHGRNAVVLAHGLMKKKAVPQADMTRALRRKHALEADPDTHLLSEGMIDG